MADTAAPQDSLVGQLWNAVQRDPDGVVAIDAGTPAAARLTRRRLWQRATRLGRELAAHGVGQGDCVAVWLPNWSDSLVWQFAAALQGAHVIGINTRYNVDEVAHVLAQAQPRVLAIAYRFAGLDLTSRLHAAVKASGVPAPGVAVVSGPYGLAPDAQALAEHDAGAGAWTPATAGDEALLPPPAAAADALAVAFTTSGSTGRPKLAGHSSRSVALHASAVVQAGGWTAGDVTLCALPLTGVFAFIPAMATIASGGTCLLEPVFEPQLIVADMERFGVTHVVGADDILGRMAEAWQQRPCALPRWRRLLFADFNGRARELAAWAEQQFGLCASGVYGSSELYSLTSLWPADTPAPRRWSGGGRPVWAAIEVRSADPQTGTVCAPGEPGELQFRGPNVVDAYLGAPGLRALQLTQDGWFRSGDLGTVLADGSFEYLCRIGDALRLKGFLVEPAEIEARLAAHDAVEIAKVVGLKLPSGDTEAVAFVVLRPGAQAAADGLRQWCAVALARHKVPRAVHIVDALPTTSGVNGTKIRSAELRLWAQQREAASASPTGSRP